MEQAIALYRGYFKLSEHLAVPRVMLGLNVCAADTDAQARWLFSSHQQALIARRTGRRGPLPPPVDDFESRLDPTGRSILQQSLTCSVVGSPETVQRGLAAFIAHTRTDEIMVTGNIFDHAARLRSYEITAQVHRTLGKARRPQPRFVLRAAMSMAFGRGAMGATCHCATDARCCILP